MEFDELTYACALNRIFGGKPHLARLIAEHFSHPGELFRCDKKTLDELFRDHEKYSALLTDKGLLRECANEVEWCAKNGIHITYFSDSQYPRRLRDCEDAPLLLFSKGNIPLENPRMIAIVGTRKPTEYGLNVCRNIIEGLSKLSPPPVIVSGLAYGIDICAHRTAIECNCKTIAVMGTSFENIYPHSHYSQSLKIIEQGSIVTEYNKGMRTYAHHFLQRNRIIAGLCDATLLIESQIKGGGMVTASIANSYSREVYAVPGRIDQICSEGCNFLIGKNIARLVTCAKEISEDLGWETKPESGRKKSKFENLLSQYDSIKRNILLTLSADLYIDLPTLIDKCNEEPSKILASVTELEMEQVIEMDIYGYYHIQI